MITFGITGGIACGKSNVTKTFRRNDIPVIDADVVARQVVEVGTFGWSMLRSLYGESYFNDDGTLNRRKLGSLVFNDPEALASLNSIMRPLINAESKRQLMQAHNDGNIMVGYDSALLCEANLVEQYRPVVLISCPVEMQVKRLMKRNHFTYNEAMARINSQMPLSEKIKMADFVIDTSGTLANSIRQTEEVIVKILQKTGYL